MHNKKGVVMADLLNINFKDDVKQLSYNFEKQEISFCVKHNIGDNTTIGQKELLNALKEIVETCLDQTKRGAKC